MEAGGSLRAAHFARRFRIDVMPGAWRFHGDDSRWLVTLHPHPRSVRRRASG